MINAERKTEPKDPVADAAKAALEANNGDVKAATAALEQRVRASRALRDMLTDPLISNACYDAIRRQCHVERRQVWSPPVEKLVATRVAGAHRVVKLAAGNLLTFPLPGGKKLGEATRAEVAQAANFYQSQSDDMGHKARWLQLVQQSIPDGKTVADVLNDKRLRELQKEARSAA